MAMLAFFAPVFAWQPGPGNASAVSGFTVDTTSRNDVASFYHSVYAESEGYKSRSNDWYGGSYSGNNHGSTTQALKDDVQRRVNFYRAMAGVPANIDFSSTHTVAGSDADTFYPGAATTKQAAAQRAAFMMSARNTYSVSSWLTSHDPASSWPKFTTAGYNGCRYSNLAVGRYGPAAIDAYVRENNVDTLTVYDATAGHRRWILYSRATTMATGDITPSSSYAESNALYIFQRQEEKLDVSQQFIAWPNQGYCPDVLVPTHWSLSYWGADFSSASVSVVNASGSTIPTTISDANPNIFKGDNSLVWRMSSINNSVSQDTDYHVTVSNIMINGVAQSYSYTVKVFDVDSLNEDQSLSGSQIPPVSGARYEVEPVIGADEVQFEVTKSLAANWNQGAETAYNLIDQTSSAYALRTTKFKRSGSYSYRLSFPSGADLFESFVVDRTIIPSSNAALKYYYRRGFMLSTSRLRVEITNNDGLSWTALNTLSGNSENMGYMPTDDNFNGYRTVSIPSSYAGQPVKFRFAFYKEGGSGYLSSTDGAGVYIDEVTLSGCNWLTERVNTSYSGDASVVSFDSTSAGAALQDGVQYILRKRTRMGNYWYPYGPMLTVVPDAALVGWEAWKEADFSGIDSFSDDDDGDGLGNGLEFALGLDPTNAFDTGTVLKPYVEDGYLVLESPFSGNLATMGVELRGQYSQDLELWANSGVAEVVDGKIRIKVDLDLDARFFRWKVDVLATP